MLVTVAFLLLTLSVPASVSLCSRSPVNAHRVVDRLVVRLGSGTNPEVTTIPIPKSSTESSPEEDTATTTPDEQASFTGGVMASIFGGDVDVSCGSGGLTPCPTTQVDAKASRPVVLKPGQVVNRFVRKMCILVFIII